jgi:hypothetical protein
MSEKEDDWRKPFIYFILDQLVLDSKVERERITRQSANYDVIGIDLYRKSASIGVLMKCILRSEGLQLLAEIQSGKCGCHEEAYRSGFHWPTTMTDAKDFVKRCKGCQFFAKQQHLPAETLRTIPPSWPFTVWGLDSVGLFRTALGGYRHILVAVDKFTNTTRNVLIDDPHPSSLKMPNWSCTLIFDVFLTNSISSNRSRHIV